MFKRDTGDSDAREVMPTVDSIYSLALHSFPSMIFLRGPLMLELKSLSLEPPKGFSSGESFAASCHHSRTCRMAAEGAGGLPLISLHVRCTVLSFLVAFENDLLELQNLFFF